jgi:hypothetical protein
VVEPLATVTVAGTCTKAELDVRPTVKLPVGAVVKVTVPVAELPLATSEGEKLREAMGSSLTVRMAFADVRVLVAYRLNE